MVIDFEAKSALFWKTWEDRWDLPDLANLLRSVATQAARDALDEAEEEISADSDVNAVFIIRALKGQL